MQTQAECPRPEWPKPTVVVPLPSEFDEDDLWHYLTSARMRLFPNQAWSEHHTAKVLATLPEWPWPATRHGAEWVASALAGFIFRPSSHPSSVAKRVADLIAPKDNAWLRLLDTAFVKESVDQFRQEYETTGAAKAKAIIAGLLNKNLPMVIGGPAKCMKSSLSEELAAALTTSTSFLGFQVERKCNVAVLTLETRPAQWRESFRRSVATRKQCDSVDASNRLFLSDDLRLLRKKKARLEFSDYLRRSETDVCILDPLYLIAPPVQSADIAAQGRMLRRLCRPIIDGGATPIIVTHSTKSVSPGDWPTLADLSGAGVGPFARSWLLLNRETEYYGGGIHSLHCLTGTSTGECSHLRIRFDEREWSVTSTPRESTTGRIGKQPTCFTPRGKK